MIKSTTPELAPIRPGSLSTQAFHVIKDAIFTGQMKPGESLRELYLARSLQVSQATIREALAQLESAGLIVRHANRRTTVTSFTREEVQDRLQLRILLEERAAVRAAERAAKEDIAGLTALAGEIVKAIESDDHYDHVQADIRFHRAIWSMAGSPILSQTLDHLTTPLFAFLAVIHNEAQGPLQATRPHERIIKAIRSKDETRIRAEIRAHIETSYSEFLTSPEPTLHAYVRSRIRRSEQAEPTR
jgi:DNA-binding GntR family transcriptional regulator